MAFPEVSGYTRGPDSGPTAMASEQLSSWFAGSGTEAYGTARVGSGAASLSDRGPCRLARPAGGRRPLRRALRLILHVGCWLYAAGVGSLWAVANWASPNSWVPHLLLYGPRWTVIVPALLLMPAQSGCGRDGRPSRS